MAHNHQDNLNVSIKNEPEDGAGLISFIIPAHNESELIERTISHIISAVKSLDQPYEIIVVNDDSSDDTAAIAERCGARVVSVCLRRISAVRNAGAKEAFGNTFIFVDADTMLPAETLCAAMSSQASGTIGGGAAIHFDCRVPWWAGVLGWLWNVMAPRKSWAAGCFIFVKREAFESVGGFDESYYVGEELVLSQALKRVGRFVILPTPVITSGRKTISHGLWTTTCVFLQLMWHGHKAMKRPDGLEYWYDRSKKKSTRKIFLLFMPFIC